MFPAEDSVVRPQETVGFDLRDDLVGVLLLDGVRIPEDQYEGDRAVGQVFWRPGEGKEFRELPEGRHRATAEYWAATKTEEEATAANEVFGVSVDLHRRLSAHRAGSRQADERHVIRAERCRPTRVAEVMDGSRRVEQPVPARHCGDPDHVTRARPDALPKNRASPNENTPPSAATKV